MTLQERQNPDILNGSRRKRIALGSGTSVQEVNQLLEQFSQMRTMIRQVSSGRGPWARIAQQYGGGTGMQMPALSKSSGGSGSSSKKTGKAARKEKRKQKARARSGRR